MGDFIKNFADFFQYLISISSSLKDLSDVASVLSLIFGGSVVYIISMISNFRKKKNTVDVFKTYSEDTDADFIDTLSNSISSATSHIVFIGLGHTIIRHNDSIKKKILATIRDNRSISLEIYYSSDNDGLKSRAKDEEYFYAKIKKNYDHDWINTFIDSAITYFRSSLNHDELMRVGVYRLSYMPMFYLINIDGDYFFYAYGAPSIRGPESPWFHCKKGEAAVYITDFFDKNISFARNNRLDNLLNQIEQ